MDKVARSFFSTGLEIYYALCVPVCDKYDVQQPGLDILIFLSENEEFCTAVDIQKMMGMKQSKVSFQIDKLVNSGYLERQSVEGDRRRIKLVYTKKAEEVIEAGKKVRKEFQCYITEGISKEDMQVYERVCKKQHDNLMKYYELMKKGELIVSEENNCG